MLTGELKSQIDTIWNAFWTGGISNPLEVIEQITYLLFLRRLDDLQTLAENKANRLGQPIERRIFPDGDDERGRAYNDLRWSIFKHYEPREMYLVLGDHVFPFLRNPPLPAQLRRRWLHLRAPHEGCPLHHSPLPTCSPKSST